MINTKNSHEAALQKKKEVEENKRKSLAPSSRIFERLKSELDGTGTAASLPDSGDGSNIQDVVATVPGADSNRCQR